MKIMENNVYHVPVLLKTAVEGLNIKPDGKYIDVTFGGGGHSLEILKALNEKGRLLVFDQDPDAAKNVPDDHRVTFVNANFSFLKNFARVHQFMNADGVLADLGVSSHQFDAGEKGFSTRFSGPLDMRMNPSTVLTAADVVNTYEANDLMRILRLYGELKNYRKIVFEIIRVREINKIETTEALVELIQKLLPYDKKIHRTLAQVFQAIRIEVNGELDVLEKMLEQGKDVLAQGGRFVVISYHSLEDRLVKNYFKRGSFEGGVEKDFYGNVLKPFKEVERKPIVPSQDEIDLNPRARSAKMRIAERDGE